MKSSVLNQFRMLHRALIDASSIIYMQDAGYLEILTSAVDLSSPREIIEETGFHELHVKPIEMESPAESNDQKLIQCALDLELPVISEDKKILMRMKRESLPHFNSLMMLNFLFFKQRIDKEEHTLFFLRLMKRARYGKDVIEFGKSVYRLIRQASR